MRLVSLHKRLLALLAATSLSLGAGACGQTAKKGAQSTSTTSGAAAVAKSEEEQGGLEGAKLDVDGDSDFKHPDGDEVPKRRDKDNDSDSSGNARYDSDDSTVLDFGHAATTSQTRQITRLIGRYYAAEAAENGAEACAMVYSTFAEAIPEDYGTSPPGPAYARGTTCPAVLSHVFTHFHGEIAKRLPKLKVARVRIMERQGVALLSFAGLSDREIRLSREGHTWKVVALTDTDLP